LNGGDVRRFGRPVQGVPQTEKDDSASCEERHKPFPLGYLVDDDSHETAVGLAGDLVDLLLGLLRCDFSLQGPLGGAVLSPGRFPPHLM
jgi:hypothetical protein